MFLVDVAAQIIDLDAVIMKLSNWFEKLLIMLTYGVYQLVSVAYQIFITLTHINIFNSDSYDKFATKIYAVLSIVTLFVVAYNVLTYIVDPDKNKGGQSAESLIKKLFQTFIIIAICPFVFSLMVRVQSAFLDSSSTSTGGGNFFDRFFSEDGLSVTTNEGATVSAGIYMEYTTFNSFFYDNEKNSNSDDGTTEISYEAKTINGETDDLVSDLKTGNYLKDSSGSKISGCDCDSGCTLEQAKNCALQYDTPYPYYWFAPAIVQDYVSFNFLAALIAGFFLAYVCIYYAFNVALRIFKLFFYELVSPLCIACKMVPSKEGVYKTWFTETKNTYLSVLIMVFVMRLEVWILSNFVSSGLDNQFKALADAGASNFVVAIAKVFVILGLAMFILKAPDLINKLFGIEEATIGSIAKKLKDTISPYSNALRKGVDSTARALSPFTAAAKSGRNNWHERSLKVNQLKDKIKNAGTKEEKKAARKELAHVRRRTFGTVTAGAASAGLHSLYRGTNKFGLGGLLEDREKRKAELSEDTKYAGKKREDRWENNENKRALKQAEKDMKKARTEIERLKAEIGDKQEKRESLNANLQAAIKAEEAANNKVKKLQDDLTANRSKSEAAQAEMDRLQAEKDNYERLRNEALGRNDKGSAAAYYKKYLEASEKLVNKTEEKGKIDAEYREIDANLSTAKVEAATAKNNKVRAQSEFDTFISDNPDLDDKIKQLESETAKEASAKEKYVRLKNEEQRVREEKRRLKIKNKYGIDVGAIIDQAETLDKKRVEAGKDVIKKFDSNIKFVNYVDENGESDLQKVFEKNNFFKNKGLGAAMAGITETYTAQQMEAVSDQLAMCRSLDEAIKFMPELAGLNLSETDFTVFKKAFRDTYSGPYLSTLSAQVGDALSGDPAYSNLFGDSQTLKKVLSTAEGSAAVQAVDTEVKYYERTHVIEHLRPENGEHDIRDKGNRVKIYERDKNNEIVLDENGKPKTVDYNLSLPKNSKDFKAMKDYLESIDIVDDNYDAAQNLLKFMNNSKGADEDKK